MEIEYFKGRTIKEKIIIILKSNPDYGFTYDELCEITDYEKTSIKRVSKELQKEGIVKITEQNDMYEKVYVIWDGYL